MPRETAADRWANHVPQEIQRKYKLKRELQQDALDAAAQTLWAGSATSNETGKAVFVKVYHPGMEYDKAVEEAAIYKEMGTHECIAALLDHLLEHDSKKATVVFELAKGQDLFSWVASKKLFTEANARQVIQEMLMGLCHAHQNSIAHRDIKYENAMVWDDGGDFHLKLIDFGIAVRAEKGTKIKDKEKIRTDPNDRCAAPELKEYNSGRLRDGYDPFMIDVYSVGILLAVLLGGAKFNNDQSRVLDLVDTLKASETVKSLLRGMLSSIGQRFTVNQCLADPWFKATNEDLDSHVIDQSTLDSLRSIQHFKNADAKKGDWVMLEQHGPRSMQILDDKMFRKRYDAKKGVPVGKPANNKDQNAQLACKQGMSSFPSSGAPRIYFEVGEIEMECLKSHWPNLKVHTTDDGMKIEGEVPTQADMLQFIEGYILDPKRADADVNEAEKWPFKPYRYQKYGVYAFQVPDDETQVKTFIYHALAEDSVTEFCFFPISAGGVVLHSPVATGDYLAYIPAQGETKAEVYRIGGAKFSGENALYYKQCYKCGCSKTQEPKCENAKADKFVQWHPAKPPPPVILDSEAYDIHSKNGTKRVPNSSASNSQKKGTGRATERQQEKDQCGCTIN